MEQCLHPYNHMSHSRRVYKQLGSYYSLYHPLIGINVNKFVTV